MDAVKVGRLIAEARKAKSMTQKDLAQRLHVSVQAVSKWERGLNFPDIALLEPLGEELELGVAELISGERNVSGQEELVRSSLQMGLTQLGGKARRWRRLFLLLSLAVLLLGGCFGFLWVRDNTDWLPQKETELIPRGIDESERMMSHLMGYDLMGVMDTLWADDFTGFTFRLELWEGEELVDTRDILSATGYHKELTGRRNSLSFLMELDGQSHVLRYSLMHGGSSVDSEEYELPHVEIRGWGGGILSQPTCVDRETGTVLACLSLDTGQGIRTVTTGNMEKPNVIPGQLAVVLRMVVESQPPAR